MTSSNRRDFLCDVGQGMLVAGLGTSLATDLGISTAFAEQGEDSIALGGHAELVSLMRQTPAEKLQVTLVKKVLNGDCSLKDLISAGALANAVTFGGCDYVGFHTAMAMLPALEMSRQLGLSRKPLPVLKVLYRNAQQIQEVGGQTPHSLTQSPGTASTAGGDLATQIRDACRQANVELGEQLLATVGDSPEKTFNALQLAVQDDLNVHRYVFAHRTYGLVRLLGREHSYSILRQCVRFCINHEQNRIDRKRPESPIRALVPKLLDRHRLDGKVLGTRDPGDEEIRRLSEAIYRGPRDRAADVAAAALADGIHPECVGEAISLASNAYVLRQGSDKWRTHGDSAGVHSSDATNAWRNMARVAEPRFAVSGLIVAAYHAGVQSAPFAGPAYPSDEHRAQVKSTTQADLLSEVEEAIRGNDQGRAAAAMQVYGEKGFSVARAFELLLKYTVSEDGRLHGEKFYHTVREEFRTTRPAFRWRQVVALARVSASAYGYNREDKHGFRAAGYEDACRLLGVDA